MRGDALSARLVLTGALWQERAGQTRPKLFIDPTWASTGGELMRWSVMLPVPPAADDCLAEQRFSATDASGQHRPNYGLIGGTIATQVVNLCHGGHTAVQCKLLIKPYKL